MLLFLCFLILVLSHVIFLFITFAGNPPAMQFLEISPETTALDAITLFESILEFLIFLNLHQPKHD